jgi:hypothetical protein
MLDFNNRFPCDMQNSPASLYAIATDFVVPPQAGQATVLTMYESGPVGTTSLDIMHDANKLKTVNKNIRFTSLPHPLQTTDKQSQPK